MLDQFLFRDRYSFIPFRYLNENFILNEELNTNTIDLERSHISIFFDKQ